MQESAALKPLGPDQVGPPWIVALRRAGKLSAEEDVAESQAGASEGRKKKKKR